jgi:hypothetical protein
MLTIATLLPLRAMEGETLIRFDEHEIGVPPPDFEFGVTGPGRPGTWSIVRDITASQGFVLEQHSDDPTDDRFDYALYRSLSLKNLTVSVRFKLISGAMLSAGVVFRYRDAGNYYVARADALDHSADIFRVRNGEFKRIAGTDADVFLDHWQVLKLVANGDQFDVSLDGLPLFTAWDRTFLTDGSIGLWTQEDNVTRFDKFTIAALPWSELP